MVHRTWTPETEKALIDDFRRENCRPEAIPKIARKLNRTDDSVYQKLRRLGLIGLNVGGARIQVSSTFEIAKNLPSPEEVLKIVAGALNKATEPGLGKTELQRLSTIVDLSKEYREGLKEYVNYKAIEAKLVELEQKYEHLAKEKSKDHASKRSPADVVQASAQ